MTTIIIALLLLFAPDKPQPKNYHIVECINIASHCRFVDMNGYIVDTYNVVYK